jgi:hypothetical protein
MERNAATVLASTKRSSGNEGAGASRFLSLPAAFTKTDLISGIEPISYPIVEFITLRYPDRFLPWDINWTSAVSWLMFSAAYDRTGLGHPAFMRN